MIENAESPVADDCPNDSEEQVHVLWWAWSDGSGQGISRVYTDLSKAKADHALVEEWSMVQWHLTSLPLTR